ncbi:MAG: PRTRC system protein E [Flavisolibacter sp.]|jgi:PRTRC genetic system protein E
MGTKEQKQDSIDRKCRVCGCTDEDCHQCIEKTGFACHWVEDDLCSACVETPEIKVVDTRAIANPNSDSSNNNDMNFFEQLGSLLGDVDMTIRFFKKNGRFTLNIMPGNRSNNIKPLIVSGTPEELDSEFFNTVAPGIKEITGIISNMDDVKKEASEKSESKKSLEKKAPVKTKKKTDKVKPPAKKAKLKEEEKETETEPSLFEAQPAK